MAALITFHQLSRFQAVFTKTSKDKRPKVPFTELHKATESYKRFDDITRSFKRATKNSAMKFNLYSKEKYKII